jgi:hypothetical protein
MQLSPLYMGGNNVTLRYAAKLTFKRKLGNPHIFQNSVEIPNTE